MVKISIQTLQLKGRLLARMSEKTRQRQFRPRHQMRLLELKVLNLGLNFKKRLPTWELSISVVNLKSLASGDNIDLVAAKMSSISASGKPLSPTEFSWELIRGFEFDGEVMSDEDAAGKSIKLD